MIYDKAEWRTSKRGVAYVIHYSKRFSRASVTSAITTSRIESFSTANVLVLLLLLFETEILSRNFKYRALSIPLQVVRLNMNIEQSIVHWTSFIFNSSVVLAGSKIIPQRV